MDHIVKLDARQMTLKLLAHRAADATVCPSEVARAMTADDQWREAMPAVHRAVDEMICDGIINLSWKGQALDSRRGPYRIALR